MRITLYAGWLLVVVGVSLVIGGFAGTGETAPFVASGLGCAVGGALMILFGHGWDRSLANAEELYESGRPANAEVLAVEELALDARGTRTAKLTVHVRPTDESDFRSSRHVAIPGGRIPVVGETITIKFDPQSRKDFVLFEDGFEVKDHVAAAAEALYRQMGR